MTPAEGAENIIHPAPAQIKKGDTDMTVTREYRRFVREAKDQLVSAYQYSRAHGNTPEDTAALLIDAIGPENAAEIVAVMVLSKGTWDARISSQSREWAAETCSYTSDELNAAQGIYYCDAVHPAHMDQIVSVFRRMAA